ncbi:TetR family transcriptional regulator C-terminal domain-containing protein [Amnibacterium sp. CER49]|uniref:TetR/AcrR family transcriptional regulator n=1 Tax=Amnibacterium sp. CER49 TaxID=3039161 RepID=UPI00244C8DCE|nr:TetR family transcriptional regulator C-terminal domain-containing protein [Amnibacterium sp. CER49]MDH2445191.1 TetR family transcriptional regulator C-terminal domain-containing protein [Amnibacterium sp. CER49]
MDTRRAARKTPDERDGEIRGAARSIALEQGLVAVTQRAVAARIGVAPALVTHYRSSMEGLVVDTFRAIVAAELDEVRGATQQGTARERLRALVATALDPSRDAVTAVWVDAWSLGRRNAALAAAVREQADAWQRHAEELVTTGVAAGEFADVEPARIAWLLLGLVDGLNAQSVIHDRHDPRRAAVVLSAVERELGVASGA